MTKKISPYELALPHRRPEAPAYQWLYEGVRSAILGGRLRAGTRLPATRDLARQYGLARGTIVNAFDLLISEGYLEGRVGSGTYVTKICRTDCCMCRRGISPSLLRRSSGGHRSRTTVKELNYSRGMNRPTRAFRANLPALDLFPTTLWTKITVRCLRRISIQHLMGCGALGYMPLRQALAEYLSTSRGVRCVPEQVAIVSGVQEALDVTSRLMLNPGDRVCVEDPGYPGAVFVFKALGARVCAAGVDGEGITISQLPSRGVRLIYLTPGHQFPLGTTMSLARRLQLLEWARRAGAMIFEDDYDSEYRYSGRPIPALQGLDEHGLVLYAGSFSKVLFPSLRLGYAVIPLDMVPHFEASLSLTCRHAPLLEQLVLTEFIAEGHFGRHLRRMREVYAERLGVLLEEARLRLAGYWKSQESKQACKLSGGSVAG